MRLTKTQRSAVTSSLSRALIACPGSGKTKVLVEKLLHEAAALKDTNRALACITFTNTATLEVEARLQRMGAPKSTQIEVSTIHAFCIRNIIAPHGWRIWGRPVRIAGENDSEVTAAIEECCQKHDVRPKDLQNLRRTTIAQVNKQLQSAAEHYWSKLDTLTIIDVGGIVFWSDWLLSQHDYISSGIASSFSWILVDEFQDTSPDQLSLLLKIHEHRRTKMFVVGDPCQSILSVNGAHPDTIARFIDATKAANDIALNENFRTQQPLLAFAERLMPRTPPMRSMRVPAESGARVAHVTKHSRAVEALAKKLVESGIEPSKIAILASKWHLVRTLATDLRAVGLHVSGPGARPYSRRSHPVAFLLEELASQLDRGLCADYPRLAWQIERTIGDLQIATATQGRVELELTGSELLRELRQHQRPDWKASSFIRSVGALLGVILERRQVLTANGKDKLKEAADELADTVPEGAVVASLDFYTKSSETIQSMTIHAAKGREFDAVIVAFVEEGELPHGDPLPGSEQELEAQRLLYVALTRARDRLYVLYEGKPSRLLRTLRPSD